MLLDGGRNDIENERHASCERTKKGCKRLNNKKGEGEIERQRMKSQPIEFLGSIWRDSGGAKT